MQSQHGLVTAIGELIADLPRSGVRLYDYDACEDALERAQDYARRGDFLACNHQLFRAQVEGLDVEDLRDAALLLEAPLDSEWCLHGAGPASEEAAS